MWPETQKGPASPPGPLGTDPLKRDQNLNSTLPRTTVKSSLPPDTVFAKTLPAASLAAITSVSRSRLTNRPSTPTTMLFVQAYLTPPPAAQPVRVSSLLPHTLPWKV